MPHRSSPLRAADPPLPGLVYQSEKMRLLATQVHRLSRRSFPILVLGESGTGKELVARAIHELSPRHAHPFISLNCASIPPYLMEAQLFGHKKGAFTGAVTNEPGVLREAHHGTVLLDEIGDLPLDLQPKLLRFLQEGEIQVVGESQPRKVDVRLIAATNRNLHERVQQGLFRDDLYHRLNIAELTIPPLRERPEDIPCLIEHFLRLYGAMENRPDVTLQPEARAALLRDEWPGNVRELSNVLYRAVALAELGQAIGLRELAPRFQPPATGFMFSIPPTPNVPDAPIVRLTFPPELSLIEVQSAFDRALVREALERAQWNISAAAETLGWARQTLRKKIKAYGFSRPRQMPIPRRK